MARCQAAFQTRTPSLTKNIVQSRMIQWMPIDFVSSRLRSARAFSMSERQLGILPSHRLGRAPQVHEPCTIHDQTRWVSDPGIVRATTLIEGQIATRRHDLQAVNAAATDDRGALPWTTVMSSVCTALCASLRIKAQTDAVYRITAYTSMMLWSVAGPRS